MPTLLTAPSVSATARLDSQSVTFGGMQQADVLELYANDLQINFQYASQAIVPASGEIVVSLTGFANTTVKARYSRSGAFSEYSQNVTVTADPNAQTKLPDLTFTRVVAGNINWYVGEEIDVTGFTAGASLQVNIGNGTVTASLNVDYSLTAITGGYRLRFLTENYFHIRQSKTGFLTSTDNVITVGAARPVLPKPLPSSFAIGINGTVTITNQATVGYTNINVIKNGNGNIVIPSQGDYSLGDGVYTFLKIGSYTLVGQKTGVNDSVASNAIIVTAVAPPTITRRKYTVAVKNYCSVTEANVQVGTATTTNANDVSNWVDGLLITLDITNGIRPNFFIRDKQNTAVVSRAYAIP